MPHAYHLSTETSISSQGPQSLGWWFVSAGVTEEGTDKKKSFLNMCMFLQPQKYRKFLGNLRHEEVMKDSGVEIIERLSARRCFFCVELVPL